MKYYIITGEASGDLHGSNLIKQIKKKDSNAIIRCWGGDLMESEGGTIVKHIKDLAFMGFWEVLLNLRSVLNNLSFCKKDIILFNPDTIIYIDYPGFNLRIAKWAKNYSFNNQYYICPQVWAWKENRVKIIRKCIDSLYVILPFEKNYFKNKHSLNVEYVGHPLVEHVLKIKKNPSFIKKNNFDQKKEIITLMPGSRQQEIKKILPIFINVIKNFKSYQFAIAAAPSIDSKFYLSLLKNNNVKIIHNNTYNLLTHSKAALVASGTATLETALLKIPQLVCYKTSPISYFIAKRLVKLNYISLVNLILNKEVVKELIQKNCNVKKITKELKELLLRKNNSIIKDYESLIKTLGSNKASKKTSQLIIDSIK
jgi:lipid-A-disaccharide synthase